MYLGGLIGRNKKIYGLIDGGDFVVYFGRFVKIIKKILSVFDCFYFVQFGQILDGQLISCFNYTL